LKLAAARCLCEALMCRGPRSSDPAAAMHPVRAVMQGLMAPRGKARKEINPEMLEQADIATIGVGFVVLCIRGALQLALF
jgi:hypothetical protein